MHVCSCRGLYNAPSSKTSFNYGYLYEGSTVMFTRRFICYWKNPLSNMLNQKSQDIFLFTPKRFCMAAIIVCRAYSSLFKARIEFDVYYLTNLLYQQDSRVTETKLEVKPVLVVSGIVCSISIIQTSPFIICCHAFPLSTRMWPFLFEQSKVQLEWRHQEKEYSQISILFLLHHSARSKFILSTNVDTLAESFH